VDKSTKKTIKLVIKLVIVALVAWGIWRAVGRAMDEITQLEQDGPVVPTSENYLRSPFRFADIHLGWLCGAGLVYLLGMLPMGLFWFSIMRTLGQRPKLPETLRAFYIGHLGKYVPGKVMVVVLRTGLIRSRHVDATIAAVSVFIETLTMMAVGAFMASTILIVWFGSQRQLLAVAAGLMLVSGVPVLPPVFRRIVKFTGATKAKPNIDVALNGLTYRLMIGGWLANLVGWCLLGLSLWMTLQAMPLQFTPGGPITLAPLTIASSSLAIVAGFLSMLPGGFGVREVILNSLMGPEFGMAGALLAAVLLRLVWTLSELGISAILYAWLIVSRRCGTLDDVVSPDTK